MYGLDGVWKLSALVVTNTEDLELGVMEIEVSFLSVAVSVSPRHPSSRCLLMLARMTLFEQTGQGILADDMKLYSVSYDFDATDLRKLHCFCISSV